MGVVIAFSLGYYKEDSLLPQCDVLLRSALRHKSIGILGELSIWNADSSSSKSVKGEPFNSEGSLSLTEKSETKKNINS